MISSSRFHRKVEHIIGHCFSIFSGADRNVGARRSAERGAPMVVDLLIFQNSTNMALMCRTGP